ncbi:MAG: flagellar basal body rod protein FlgC [Syntrophales bacterium]|nr:flagellar basal body rod protein FlgC [Syntrophales bacterium]
MKMDINSTFKICADAMTAQRVRLDVVTSNLANINTTKTPSGEPYRRKIPVFSSTEVQTTDKKNFKETLKTVKVEILEDSTNSFKTIYDPQHPDADSQGMVKLPNINVIQEMAEMIAASRSFEASVTAFDATKNMLLKSLDIGK